MEILGLIFLVIITVFISPFLYFLGGWISGWLIKVTIGSTVAAGLAIVGINLPLDKFPLFFGTLAIISSFFRNTDIKNKKEN